jgi:hypothetical protein
MIKPPDRRYEFANADNIKKAYKGSAGYAMLQDAGLSRERKSDRSFRKFVIEYEALSSPASNQEHPLVVPQLRHL